MYCKQCNVYFNDSQPQTDEHGQIIVSRKNGRPIYMMPDICFTCRGIARENIRRRMVNDTNKDILRKMPPARSERVYDAELIADIRYTAKMPDKKRRRQPSTGILLPRVIIVG